MLEKGIKAADKNPEGYYNLGMMRMKQKNYRSALNNFNRAISIKPDESRYHAAKAEALLKLGRTSEALAALIKAVELDRTNAGAAESAGDILLSRSEYGPAEKYYKKALQFNSKDSGLRKKYEKTRSALSDEQARNEKTAQPAAKQLPADDPESQVPDASIASRDISETPDSMLKQPKKTKSGSRG